MNRIQRHISKKRNERGFTLIELLIVIIILGILAAVVVFAAGGLGDKGQLSACKTDARTLRTAEEAAITLPAGLFLPEDDGTTDDPPDDLVDSELIVEASELHDIELLGDPVDSYNITAVGKCAPLSTETDPDPCDPDVDKCYKP